MLGLGTIAIAAQLRAGHRAQAGRERRAGSQRDGTARGSSLASDARLSPRPQGPCLTRRPTRQAVSPGAPGSGWGVLKSEDKVGS